MESWNTCRASSIAWSVGEDAVLELTLEHSSGRVNIVIFPSAARYLVDVGTGQMHSAPQPLVDGWVFQNINENWSRLNHFLDYQLRSCKWTLTYYASDDVTGMMYAHELYSFAEVEFLPEDFKIISAFEGAKPDFMPNDRAVFVTLALPRHEGRVHELRWVSLWNQEILLCKIPHGDTSQGIKRLEFLRTEADRERALKNHFNIQLTESEKLAIVGRPMELKAEQSGSPSSDRWGSGSSSDSSGLDSGMEMKLEEW